MLTPLEKELLTYVEELTTACEASTKQLKASEAALMSLEGRLMQQSKLMSRDLIYTVIALADSQMALMASWHTLSDGGDLDLSKNLNWEENLSKLQEATNRLNKVFKWMTDAP